jgi:hypothetical protein
MCTELAMDKEAGRLLPFCSVVFNRRFGEFNCFHLQNKIEIRAGNARVRYQETKGMAWHPERSNWIQSDRVRPKPGPEQSRKKVRIWKCHAGKRAKELLRNVKREIWRGIKWTRFYALMLEAAGRVGISAREASDRQLAPRSADDFKVNLKGSWRSYTASTTKAIQKCSAKGYVAFLLSTN